MLNSPSFLGILTSASEKGSLWTAIMVANVTTKTQGSYIGFYFVSICSLINSFVHLHGRQRYKKPSGTGNDKACKRICTGSVSISSNQEL